MASALFNIETGLELENNYGVFSANGNVVINALQTASGLYWTGNGKAISGITITASSNPPTVPPPSIGDQWYNTSTDVIYEYIFDGNSTFWVDISSAVIAANTSTTAPSTVITDAIKANIGAYQVWSNNSISAYKTWANGRITTLDANLGTTTNNISNIVTQANANTAAYLITATGNISAGNVTAGAARLSSDRDGEIYANNFIFSGNGQSIFESFGVNGYGDAQVAQYLPTYTGNISAGNITVTNWLNTGNLFVNSTTGGYFFNISSYAAPAYGTQTWKFWANPNLGGPGSRIEFPDGSSQYTAYTGTADSVTNGVYTTDTGTVTNPMLANSSLTVNGTSISLGGSGTVTADAGTLTGTTLVSTVVNSSLTSVGTLGSLAVTYTPGSTVGAAIQVTAKDTQGGVGWADFLKVTNTTSGATNSTKWLRLNGTGGIEIINSAYTAQVFSVSDSGIVNAGSQFAINGLQAVNGPTFQAFLLQSQAFATGTTANVIYQGALYDTHNCYNTSTGVFKPNVAGYYQFNWTAGANSYPASTGIVTSSLRRNNNEYARGFRGTCNTGGIVVNGSAQCYLNGTTDYVHITFLQGSGGTANLENDASALSNPGSYANYFSGSMIRGA